MIGVPPVESDRASDRVRCSIAEAGRYLSGQDPPTWTDWGRPKSQHASQQSRPVMSRGVPSHFAASRRHAYLPGKMRRHGIPGDATAQPKSHYGSEGCRFESCRARSVNHLETPGQVAVSPYTGFGWSSRILGQGTQGVGCRAHKDTVQRPSKSA